MFKGEHYKQNSGKIEEIVSKKVKEGLQQNPKDDQLVLANAHILVLFQ